MAETFEVPAPPEQKPESVGVSMWARLASCAVASLVAVVPAVAAAYCAFAVSRFFGNMVYAQIDEPLTVSRIAGNLTDINKPFVVAICFAAFLAIAYGIYLAVAPQQRLASVGMPFSMGAPILGGAAALLLWRSETLILDLFAFQYDVTELPRISPAIFVLATYMAALLALAASFLGSLVSLLRSPHSRGEPLSAIRATIWIIGGVLLMVCAGAFYFRITG